ncbi:hypothetical protein FVE85_2108 [Porphyridium purpureum]|uniref:Uncharacterized protein n=1 Tax=Porphyridium purpureum TaxID=35688 RepID=A0A5J4YZA1_PORPP|nr:hypothetical protein FVE85_2108 [Porphyridium purpureum]|eukprot:POR9497..scf209_3
MVRLPVLVLLVGTLLLLTGAVLAHVPISVCEYSDQGCSEGEICYSLDSDECTEYNGLGGTPFFKYSYTCGRTGALRVGGGYFQTAQCVLGGSFSTDFIVETSDNLQLNTCYALSRTVMALNSRRFTAWDCAGSSPSPVPTPTPVCVDAEWIEERGLSKVHATDGFGEMLCISGLDDLPCGTPDHVIEVSVQKGARMRTATTRLRTYAELCAERDCTTKVGRFNGVVHSDAYLLPSQDGHRVTSVARRGSTWSEIENRLVLGAQAMGSPRVNRLLTYLQRRNTVAHLSGVDEQ